jgi:hypothetical protein
MVVCGSSNYLQCLGLYLRTLREIGFSKNDYLWISRTIQVFLLGAEATYFVASPFNCV